MRRSVEALPRLIKYAVFVGTLGLAFLARRPDDTPAAAPATGGSPNGDRAERPARWRRATAVVAKVLGWMAVAAVLAVATVLVLLPRLTGGTSLTVLTSSMRPGIPAGSVVVIRPVDYDAVRPGDVITYQKSPTSRSLVTHRVVRLDPTTDPRTLVTKGDANDSEDDAVPEGAIRGKVWFDVPYLGYVKNWATTPRGLMLLVFVPMLLLVARDNDEAQPARRRRRRRPGPDAVDVLAVTLDLPPRADGAVALADRLRGRVLEQRGSRCTIVVAGRPAEIDEAERFLADCGYRPERSVRAPALDVPAPGADVTSGGAAPAGAREAVAS